MWVDEVEPLILLSWIGGVCHVDTRYSIHLFIHSYMFKARNIMKHQGQQTTAWYFLYLHFFFCNRLLCRLTPPLCLNFLGLIHMDTHVTQQQGLEETTYTQVHTHSDACTHAHMHTYTHTRTHKNFYFWEQFDNLGQNKLIPKTGSCHLSYIVIATDSV